MRTITTALVACCVLFLLSSCGRSHPDENISGPNIADREPRAPENSVSDELPTEAGKPDGIYIIFDASGSMWGQLADKTTKLAAARKVLNDFVGGDLAGYELALRAYGHRKKDDCEDSELIVPFGPAADVVLPIRDFVTNTNALGKTPITFSLQKALQDFGDRSGEMILITDGIESCDADPCELIKEWRASNVKIKVHVVGFGVDEKSKDALKCLSDAAGTEYFDARSGKDLSDALKKIRDNAAKQGVVLKGLDPSGKEVLTHGSLSRNGQVISQLSSTGRFQIEPGEYSLSAGVRTINGNVYKPVVRTVQILGSGETVLRVDVTLPPRVRAVFHDTQAEARLGSLVTVLQDGKQISTFRPIDEVFIEEGRYEFRANPQNTGEVKVSEVLVAGDRKEISFKLVRTVRVFISLKAEGSAHIFRVNAELWQSGVKKFTVHIANGAIVPPGTYTVVMPDELTPFKQADVVVDNRPDQKIDINIPVGFITFVYQKADGSPDNSIDRVFVSQRGRNQRQFRRSFEPVPLTPGNYVVGGWTQRGYNRSVSFDVAAGERKQIVISP